MEELVVWVLNSWFGLSEYEVGHWSRRECLELEDDDWGLYVVATGGQRPTLAKLHLGSSALCLVPRGGH